MWRRKICYNNKNKTKVTKIRMRVLFYTAVAIAASIAQQCQAINFEPNLAQKDSTAMLSDDGRYNIKLHGSPTAIAAVQSKLAPNGFAKT